MREKQTQAYCLAHDLASREKQTQARCLTYNSATREKLNATLLSHLKPNNGRKNKLKPIAPLTAL